MSFHPLLPSDHHLTALCNLMNRMLEGSVTKASAGLPDFTPDKARASRYSGLLKLIGVS